MFHLTYEGVTAWGLISTDKFRVRNLKITETGDSDRHTINAQCSPEYFIGYLSPLAEEDKGGVPLRA